MPSSTTSSRDLSQHPSQKRWIVFLAPVALFATPCALASSVEDAAPVVVPTNWGESANSSTASAHNVINQNRPEVEPDSTASRSTVVPIQRAKAAYQPPSDCEQCFDASAHQVDWMTLPSTYTHDQQGERVDQYNSGNTPTVVLRNDIQRSGYRHTRSTIQAGFTSDNYHLVESWGGPVQPYGEWRYPYRPFAVPYGQWGPQLPNVMGGGGWMGGYPGMPNMGPNPGLLPGPGNAMAPTQDDYYPQAPILNAPNQNWPQQGGGFNNGPPFGPHNQNGPQGSWNPSNPGRWPNGNWAGNGGNSGWNGSNNNGGRPHPGWHGAPGMNAPSPSAGPSPNNPDYSPHSYGLK